ncbi:MAG: hypothetical protein PWR25_150 [Euryarchaeota archaeon]|jgi:hypothetical protein|nr:hypothetical protein [Euryarchaeota archaeon]MDN5339762.1 hypothetical protein [Euryarchaeota archaeon]
MQKAVQKTAEIEMRMTLAAALAEVIGELVGRHGEEAGVSPR